MSSETPKSTAGSGNVFADLALPDASELLVKARFVSRILETIRVRGWTQKRAAEALGVKQPDISDLKRGQLWKFSLDRLIDFNTRLDQPITITFHSPDLPDEELHIPCEA